MSFPQIERGELIFYNIKVEEMEMAEKELSTVLTELRKEYGYTQKEIGEKIGVTDKTISKWEKGNLLPDITYLMQLADVYDITLDELLKGVRYGKDKNRIYGNIGSSSEKSDLIFLIMMIVVLIFGTFIAVEYVSDVIISLFCTAVFFSAALLFIVVLFKRIQGNSWL